MNSPLLSSKSPELLCPRIEPFPWYGICVKANRERRAAAILTGKGFKPYLPLYTESRRWSDRTMFIERPLFPGYLFCRFDPARRVPIITTAGVILVLGDGTGPISIPDTEIAAVEAVLHSGLAVRPCQYLNQGQRVQVTRGSLKGVEGLLLRQKSQWRLVISVSLLQRSLLLEIDRDWVASV